MKSISPLFVSFVILFFNFNLFSQKTLTGIEAESRVPNSEQIIVNEKNNTIMFVIMKNGSFIGEKTHLDWLKSSVLKLNSDYQLELYKKEQDELGFVHYRYKEIYKGVKVEHGVYYVHVKNGRVESVNGEFYPDISQNLQTVTATVSKSVAFIKAKSLFISKEIMDHSQKQTFLTILHKNNIPHLCYRFELSTHDPLKHSEIYIDAHSNTIILEINKIHTTDVPGTLGTNYSGTKSVTIDQVSSSQYRLQQSAKNIYTKNCNNGSTTSSTSDFTNTTSSWTASTAVDKSVFDLYYGLEKTYDYYLAKFSRNSFDGSGAQIKGVAHYGYSFNNAFWDGTYMVFGDGDGSSYNPFSATDIVGHELTHAVTEKTAGLVYMNESGGLNESFSDIFGVSVDFYANPTTANFLEGEQCSLTNTPFRDMTNPKATFQPNTYLGQYWVYAGGGDDGGVHTNSQIQNHWFYLLCQGGNGTNDNAVSYTINGIGISNAEKIAYRNLTTYLTPNSTFADARTYAVQSAIDLYGQCSNNVIQCTNAWYAVGVGSGFYNNAVTAQFSSANLYSCSIPASVSFTNASINSSSYLWNFGDGSVSTATNPVHTYTAVGNYTVKLKSIGTSSCNTTDSVTKTNYITVTNIGSPVSACIPAQGSNDVFYGITKVEFASISKTSLDASEGYQDFMCTNQTTLTAGNPYLIKVTIPNNQERVAVWIDYNNDGNLNSSNELILNSLNATNSITTHTLVVSTPTSAVLNTPLRLRVYDDNNTIATSCSAHVTGQTEDYTVKFYAAASKPIANFFSDVKLTTTNTTVNFFDSTLNAPTNYKWYFQGALPSTSTAKNPSVSYPSVGTYSVKLVVTNTYGADSITKVSYINIVNAYNMCASTNSTSTTTGILYDSGGPSGNYANGENCQFLINPGCPGTITANFTQFSLDYGFDRLSVYNGTNTSAPLLGYYSGFSIPPTLTASSGKMLFVWYSDSYSAYPGFALNWTSSLSGTIAPVANFSLSTTTPPLSTNFQLTDQTTNTPYQWLWQFDDGTTSSIQNPIKAFSTSGVHIITLSATNCNTTSIVTKTVNVQSAPSLTVTPTSLTGSANCGDSLLIPITLMNNGTGTLVYNSSVKETNDTVKVLICTYGVSMTAGGDYTKLLNAISSYYTKYSVSQYSGNTASGLQSAALNKDVVLFPRQTTNTDAHYATYGSVLSAFATNGGSVIFCGSNGIIGTTRPITTGLFGGYYYGYMNYSSTIALPNDSLVYGIGVTTFNSNLSYMGFTTAKITPVTLSGYYYDVVSYTNIGSGKAIFIGSEFSVPNNQFSYILAQAIKRAKATPISISYLSAPSGSLAAAGTRTAQVVIKTNGKPAGVYTSTLSITGNNPSPNPYLAPITYTVNGAATSSISSTCINAGTVQQYTTRKDSVMLYNLGCSPMTVSSLSITNTAYTYTPSTSFTLAPWSNRMVYVTLTPLTYGNFNDTLRITNNGGNLKICLNTTVTAAPIMNAIPGSLTATITSCNDSIIKYLKLKNTGTANLTFSISNTVSTAANDFLIIDHYKSGKTNFNPHLTQLISETTYSSLSLAQLKNNKVVYFEPDWSNYNNLTNNMGTLSSYVSQGGIAVINVASNYGYNSLNVDPYGTDYNASTYHNAETINVSSHPYITGTGYGGYPLGTTNFNNWSSTDYGTLTNYPPGSTVLSNPDGTSFIKYPFGNGFVILTTLSYGWGYGYDTNAHKNLIDYAYYISKVKPKWTTYSDTLGTVVPGDSLTIAVKFKSAGLVNSTYTYSVNINSNDPVNPVVKVPLTLVVNGTPSIALSKSCFNFTNTVAYTSIKDSVLISNTGCDTLRISNVTSSSSAFAAPLTALAIAPGATKYLNVVFTPTAAVAYSGTLTITNNATAVTMCLTGTGLPAPVITASPSTLNATLNACNTTQTVNLTVGNSGGTNLNFSLLGSSNTNSVNILVIMNNVSIAQQYSNILNSLNTYSVNYTITQHMLTNLASFQNALVGKQVLLIPQPSFGYTTGQFQTYSTTIANFANNGGTVIMSGLYSTIQVNDIGLFNSTYNYYINPGYSLNAVDTNDVIMNNVPIGLLTSSYYVYYNTLTNTDATHYIKYGSDAVVSKRQTGLGRAILMGYDFYNYDVLAGKILSNAVKSSGTNPPWLQSVATSGTLTPGSNSTTTYTFNSGILAAGTYTTNISIVSNDPLTPTYTVPVTMVVNDNPCASFDLTNSNNCTGIVTFTNNTINTVTSYNWDFGNGTTSTLKNPTITYASSGTYAITLTACNGTMCSSYTKTLTLTGVGGPITASCTPTNYGYGYGYGILNVNLNTINKSSNYAYSEGYQDYSCNNQTTLTLGTTYVLNITTSTYNYENVSAWIDFDNNGIFSTSEQILNSQNVLTNHTLNFTPPVTAVLNTPLRMRITDEYSSYTINSGCYNSYYGQTEDYTIRIQPNNVPPIALFSTQINSCQGKVNFTDNSFNTPTSWVWNFGDGTASSLQNPNHTYTTAGTYTVLLVASNSYGSHYSSQIVTVNPLTFNIGISGVLLPNNVLTYTTNLSGGLSYTWDFGDGNLSGNQLSTHQYTTAGTYTVKLTILSGSCVNTMTAIVVIGENVGVNETSQEIFGLTVFPNPFYSQTTLKLKMNEDAEVTIELLNTLGQKLKNIADKKTQPKGTYDYSTGFLAKGMYLLKVTCKEKVYIYKLISID